MPATTLQVNDLRELARQTGGALPLDAVQGESVRIMYVHVPSAWMALFIYSKIPELFDTFFIVARQSPLIFLHWYHHLTVLLYCWHSYATEAPHALYFVAMNFCCHASAAAS